MLVNDSVELFLKDRLKKIVILTNRLTYRRFHISKFGLARNRNHLLCTDKQGKCCFIAHAHFRASYPNPVFKSKKLSETFNSNKNLLDYSTSLCMKMMEQEA